MTSEVYGQFHIVISYWKFAIVLFKGQPHWLLCSHFPVWHRHCIGVLGERSIVRESDRVTLESIRWTNDLQLPSTPSKPLDTWGNLYWNVLCWNATGATSCWAVTHAALQNQAAYANLLCCHPRSNALAQRYYINKTHTPENVNYLPPAPFDGPMLDGQIGINLGRMGPV